MFGTALCDLVAITNDVQVIEIAHSQSSCGIDLFQVILHISEVGILSRKQISS